MDKPFILCHIEKPLDFTIFDAKWLPCSAKCVAVGNQSNGQGTLKLFEINDGGLSLLGEHNEKTGIRNCSFGASALREAHIAITTFDGHLKLLDLKRLDASPTFNVKAHTGMVNCLDAIGGSQLNCGAPEIVTGGVDGYVKIWDLRQKDTAVASMSPQTTKKTETIRECWAVGFGNSFNSDERAICAGYDNGDLKMFDLRQMKCQWETNVKNGICGVEFDRRDIPMNKLTVATLEGGLYVYDLRTQHQTKGFAYTSEMDAGRSLGSNGVISGTKATVWCARHLPQNREIFVTCGGTGSLRLWLYKYPDKRVKDASDGCKQGVAGSLQLLQATSVSSQPINSFDWCSDHTGLAVCSSFDQVLRILLTTKLNLY